MVNSINGLHTVHMEGKLPPSVEGAVLALIALAKGQQRDIQELQKQIVGLADRIAGQSELLSKRAEKAEVNNERITDLPAVQTPMGPLPGRPVSGKRGK